MSTENGVSGSDESSFTFEQFVALHKAQLQSSGIPELFWQTLFIKLKNEVIGFRDIGSVHRCLEGGRVVRWFWVNFQCRGVLQF